MLGQLVDSDYLLDFDIFHVSAVTELLHYVDGKYLGGDLGAVGPGHVDTWIQTQHHVDRFTLRYIKAISFSLLACMNEELEKRKKLSFKIVLHIVCNQSIIVKTFKLIKLIIISATQIAKRLAEFISILNKEDVSRLTCQEKIIEVWKQRTTLHSFVVKTIPDHRLSYYHFRLQTKIEKVIVNCDKSWRI